MNGNCGSQNNIYIGARYVPMVVGDWSADVAYEPLTIVLYQGASYTSKTYVPKGIIPSENTKQYWALTGNYNAQVELYRQEVERLKKLITKTYGTLELMKTDETIKQGEYLQTFSLSVNGDNGGGIFFVENQNSNKFQFQLNNGLYATLINPQNITQLNLQSSEDISPILNMILKAVEYFEFDGLDYNIKTPIIVPSDTVLNFNGSTINRSLVSTEPMLELQSRIDGKRTKNIEICNGKFVGSGNANDQGSAITANKCDHLYIHDIETFNTDGDGLLLRDNTSCRVINYIVNDYGRNGVSMDSGENYLENVRVIGRPLSGANPAISFDIENDVAEEGNKAVIENCYFTNIFIVDFFNADIFAHELEFRNTTIENNYHGVHLEGKAGVKAKKIIFDNSNIINSRKDGTFFYIKNVNGVEIDGVYMEVFDNAKVNGITIIGEVSLEAKDINIVNLGSDQYTVLCYNSADALVNSKFYNSYIKFYNKKIANNYFQDCRCLIITEQTATSIGNTFNNCYLNENSTRLDKTKQYFGVYQDKGIQCNRYFYISENTGDYGNPIVVNIPLPSSAKGARVMTLIASSAHRTLESNIAYEMSMINYFINESTSTKMNRQSVFKYGTKTFEYAYDNDVLTITIPVNNTGSYSFTLLG